GRKGHFSLEDFLCGGAIAEELLKRGADFSDSSFGALLAFGSARTCLYGTIIAGEHARHLKAIGFEEDVRFSCQLDLYSIVPVYKDGLIELPM
ncbi:MAG: 2-phosphosulfolactate phosphatase, partial [Candidatus Bathyarchaeota archaeon]|nr:2-phosphosulfolactate phosphatase [Candidatus Bathyarchaeota archaeon]